MVTREVTWGQALIVEAFKSPGGIRVAVDAIRHEVGSTIGVRNSFSKLLRADAPDDLSDRDQWRAWLLIAAFGQDPNEWGISDEAIPPAFNGRALKKSLPKAVRQWAARPKGFEPLTSWFGARRLTLVDAAA